jgi:hypothetical protein
MFFNNGIDTAGLSGGAPLRSFAWGAFDCRPETPQPGKSANVFTLAGIPVVVIPMGLRMQAGIIAQCNRIVTHLPKR